MDESNVMVVDDEPTVCERVKEHLEARGFGVETFGDGASALRALEQKRFHVIVTDLKMAGPSGLDVLQNVRLRGYPAQVILISGYASLEAAREAEAMGAYEVLCKPFQLKELAKLVKGAARRARRGIGPGTGSAPAGEAP
jgi:DNA-binding NtrC family response regulator